MTKNQRQLIWELAVTDSMILRVGSGYRFNSLPIRRVMSKMVSTLVQTGVLRKHERGYYVLTVHGQLLASLEVIRRRI